MQANQTRFLSDESLAITLEAWFKISKQIQMPMQAKETRLDSDASQANTFYFRRGEGQGWLQKPVQPMTIN